MSRASDGEGRGLALQSAGFIGLCLGLKPSLRAERKSSLWGVRDGLCDATGVATSPGAPALPPPKVSQDPASLRPQGQKTLSCFWGRGKSHHRWVSLFALTDRKLRAQVSAPLGESSRPTPHQSSWFSACLRQPRPPSDLFLSYCDLPRFVSASNPCWNKAGHQIKTSSSGALWPWGTSEAAKVISGLESCRKGRPLSWPLLAPPGSLISNNNSSSVS